MIEIDRIQRAVNQMSNKKLKMAYRLIMVSGLRISEVADLEPRDIEFLDKYKIRVHVRNGKGGKERYVTTTGDRYLYEGLEAHKKPTEAGDKLFYGEAYMRKKAYELDFEPHDLRRAYAQNTKRLHMAEGKSAQEAAAIVQNDLGHKLPRTTSLYLTGRKVIY